MLNVFSGGQSFEYYLTEGTGGMSNDTRESDIIEGKIKQKICRTIALFFWMKTHFLFILIE